MEPNDTAGDTREDEKNTIWTLYDHCSDTMNSEVTPQSATSPADKRRNDHSAPHTAFSVGPQATPYPDEEVVNAIVMGEREKRCHRGLHWGVEKGRWAFCYITTNSYIILYNIGRKENDEDS
ncbi:hypothetical protein PTI98_012933 [Pleurotus ostreatus]|nr:hypothetical protein PTI98_012933 [Pleurotus ostreatus]